MKKALALFVMAFIFGITGIANAALWDRGGGLIYDDVLDITWSQDALLSGPISKPLALDALDTYNAEFYCGFNDWRLPSKYTDNPAGMPELNHLYYDENIRTAPNDGIFENVQNRYWIMETSNWSGGDALRFLFDSGEQVHSNATDNHAHVWLVRDGDVPSVPIPSTVWLLGSGLIGLVGLRRKFRKS